MKFDKTKRIYFFSAIVIFAIAVFVIILSTSGSRSFYRYSAAIKKYSESNKLEPSLVAALVRAESDFDKGAVSDKGAIGLMQLMPETAEYIAELIGYNKKIDLKSPECNICLGTAYLAYLFKKFDNETAVLCAYNAGEGRVSRWLNDPACSVDGATLNYIPFSETRKYVERIGRYRLRYERVFKTDGIAYEKKERQSIQIFRRVDLGFYCRGHIVRCGRGEFSDENFFVYTGG